MKNTPLEDVTVLDLTTALAGPFATLLLAGLGPRSSRSKIRSAGAIAAAPMHPISARKEERWHGNMPTMSPSPLSTGFAIRWASL
jgi:hypothetical protein